MANYKQYQGRGREGGIRARKQQENKIKREKEEKGWDRRKEGGKEMEGKGDKSGEREHERKRRKMDCGGGGRFKKEISELLSEKKCAEHKV